MKKYILDKSCFVTAGINVGSTSFVQAVTNNILSDFTTLYIGFSINRSFIGKNYINLYNNTVFFEGNLETLTEFMYSSVFDEFKYIIFDPGDILLVSNTFPIFIADIIKTKKQHIICTSQIRIDTSTGKPYGTLDRLNERLSNSNIQLFDYSLWIRNVTEPSVIFDNKYLDIYSKYRDRSNFVERYLLKYNKEGKVLYEENS